MLGQPAPTEQPGGTAPGQAGRRHEADETVGLAAVGQAPLLHSPPPLGHGHSAPGAGDRDALAVSVRNQVVDRMVALNRNHARIAFESPGTPICPHAVAFLYLDAVPTTSAHGSPTVWRKVVAASRVVPDTPDVRELPTLLFRLARLAKDRYLPTPGGFDPAVHMSVYRDETVSPAEYIGIGVSTLDTTDGLWEQVCGRADDIDDLSGRAFALLADHTAILVDRPPARRARRDLGIHATGDLNYHNGLAPRMWSRHRNVSTLPADPEIWELMHELHQVTYQQDRRPTL
jgi:hypothetical protein